MENLKIYAQFARSTELIVKGADFCVQSGEPLAVVGESGSGKTMCALALLGLLPENCFAEGKAQLFDESDSYKSNLPEEEEREISEDMGLKCLAELISKKERDINKLRGKELVYIPQSGAEFLNPALKVGTQIYESLKKLGIKGKDALKSAALEKLTKVGLDNADILEKYPHQLSGGQAQRVVLAIAHCSKPMLVIADEPTKGIDRETAKLFVDSIKDFDGACVIVITHDMELASKCKSILVLKDGEVQEYGSAKDVVENPKSEYTKQLIAALPRECEEADYA